MRQGALSGALAAAIMLFAVSPAGAVMLVTPEGQPVGGQWQRWANQSRVPTVPGNLTFLVNDPTACGGPAACSLGAPWMPAAGRWTAVSDGPSARYEFYFELGHQFDWERLTWRDRTYLADHWTIRRPDGLVDAVRHWHWENTARAVALHGEDGLEWAFAAIYADCAMGNDDEGASLTPFEPNGVMGPTVVPNINVCRRLPDAY